MKTVEHTKNYKKICQIAEEANLLSKANALLEWDQETYMPSKGIDFKAKQNKLLQMLSHKMATSKKYAALLSALEKEKRSLSEDEQINIALMREDYEKQVKLPSAFLQKYAEATTLSCEAWKEAKATNRFKLFYPHLKKVVDLNKKKAELLGYKESPYDALIDLYEPKMTAREINAIFSPLKQVTIELMKTLERKGYGKRPNPLSGKHFPKAEQQALCQGILQDMGLSPSVYNLSESAHPFCSSQCPTDIRLTTHYHEGDFLKSFTGAVHEGGHALYEHGLPLDPSGTPLSQAASSGVHESQSRFWETCIALSRPFWNRYFPKIQKAFPEALQGISFEAFYHTIIEVEPSLIRIFADPVTYNLHIILRTEIEEGFITETLNPKDLPDIWKTKMQESLGLTPPSDAEGCLQDIHWSLGYFGYFPTYSLGNLYAGALFIDLIKTHSDWDARLLRGEFSFINTYMKEKIHRHGRKYPPLTLIKNACNISGSAPWDALIESHKKRLLLLYP